MNRIVFGLLLVTGLALRGYAAVHTQALAHPDEHQQYLEQAHRLAFGYGKTFWEQERSMRHELYPGMLARLLLLADQVGLRDPLAQAAFVRFVLATSVFVLLAAYAWRWQGQGRTVAAGV